MSQKWVDRFTETQMLKLAEIYRDYDCLWNVSSEFYKDRCAREGAYINILKRLNIPGLSVKDVPRKIKNLRSSYYQELKKIQTNRRSGDFAYKPKVSWFATVQAYLKPFTNRRELYLYNGKDSNSASDSEMETQDKKPLDTLILEEISISAEENIEAGCKVENCSDISVLNESPSSSQLVFKPSNLSKTRNIDNKEDDIQIALAKLDQIASTLTQSASSLIEKRDDEFDTFGKYIATILRSLPKELAIAGQIEVQKIISDIQLRALRQNSEPTALSCDTSIVKEEFP